MLVLKRSILAPPYRALSRAYDAALGARFFRRSRRAFLSLANRFGIVPRVAADLGAGTGLFAAWLSRRLKIRVYAVDKSDAMLRAGSCNLLSTRVIPLRQDIRTLVLPEPVDLATAHYDTINHLLRPADVRAAFEAVRRSLRPRGFFLFDFITPSQHVGVQRHRVRCPGRLSVAQRIRYLPRRRLLSITVTVRRKVPPCRFVERHYERAYSPRAIVHWLHEAGFTVRDLVDARTLGRVRHSVPPRIVVVAQRA